MAGAGFHTPALGPLSAYSCRNCSAVVGPPCAAAHCHSAYVAKPSFSQMSPQSFGVTELPYHWWANSWMIVDSSVGPSNTGRVWVSSA